MDKENKVVSKGCESQDGSRFFATASFPRQTKADFHESIDFLSQQITILEASYGGYQYPYRKLHALNQTISNLTDPALKRILFTELLDKVLYKLLQLSPKLGDLIFQVEQEIQEINTQSARNVLSEMNFQRT